MMGFAHFGHFNESFPSYLKTKLALSDPQSSIMRAYWSDYKSTLQNYNYTGFFSPNTELSQNDAVRWDLTDKQFAVFEHQGDMQAYQ